MRSQLISCASQVACATLVAALPAQSTRNFATTESLSRFADAERDANSISALSIAVWTDDKLAWSAGFGDAAPGTPASGGTVYRAASISKMFTAYAALLDVEAERLNLDTPMHEQLTSFAPSNSFRTAITLRHLLSHRAGIVREPPIGHYFEAGASLAATVASLNATTVRFAPGSRFAYSNAGLSVVGYCAATVTGFSSWEDYISARVLTPLALTSSSFDSKSAIAQRCATGQMWTVDGRRFHAPKFSLGTAPAGNLYSSVEDLVRFASACFVTNNSRSATHKEMFTPQFTDSKSGVGLGCFIDYFDEALRVRHGGAIYGHASELAFLPEARIAVAVACTKDCAGGAVRRIADAALRAFVAARSGQAISDITPRPHPLGTDRARKLSGRYGDNWFWVDLEERDGDLVEIPCAGPARIYRELDGAIVADGPHVSNWASLTIAPTPTGITRNAQVLHRQPDTRPPAAPTRLLELIGEYGPDHNTLYIFEDGGRLHCLIEWFYRYPLAELSRDHFEMPNAGLYPQAEVRFERDQDGTISRVRVEGIAFERRAVGTDGATFKIEARFPPERLRAMAREARMPKQSKQLREPDLVDITNIDPTIRLDIRYASKNNFMDMVFYEHAKALLQRPAAEAVARVHQNLAPLGLGLMILDAYRPWGVTKMFWDATPESQKDFVANPERGSRHNRGCAVDLTLFDLVTGDPVEMVSGYDEFTPRAYPHYPGGTQRQRWYRKLLRTAMEAEGFSVYEWEWWHFDFHTWQEYPVLNEEIR